MPLRKIIIDTDPGIDDAVALLLALAAREELEVLGIVAVAGNLPLEETLDNARLVCELARRRDVKVYGGCAKPLLRPLTAAAAIHGTSLAQRLGIPEPSMPVEPQHGDDFIIEAVRMTDPGAITLVALGPLTNIAVALRKAPDIAARIGQIVMMGGAAFEIGNVTPAAEFNIYVDPHAAAIVLDSGLPITMVPLDVTHQVLSTPARLARLRALPNRCGPTVASLLADFEASRAARFGERGLALHDPCAVAYLLRPGLFRGRRVNVAVETESALALGLTAVDWWGVTPRAANVDFMTEIAAEPVYQLLNELLSTLP